MFDQELTDLANEFANDWNSLFVDYPRYKLDFTWPSLGTLDILLQPVRVQAQPGEEANRLMLGAGAYLSLIWHTLWSSLEDQPNLKVQFQKGSPERILIEIRGGKYLTEKEKVSLDLMPVLWEIVRFPKREFPFFEHTAIDIDLGFQRLPLFFLGMLTGLSPYMDGPWKLKNDRDLEDYLLASELFLSASTAAYYERVFPSELFGQRPENYLLGMVMPPPHHRQSSIISRPLFRLLSKELSENENHPLWLKNLSTVPLQLLSLPALIARIAQTSGELDERLPALVNAQGRTVADLRFALSFARTLLGRPGLPEVALDEQRPQIAENHLAQEIELDFYPNLFLSAQEVLQRQSTAILLSLAQADFAGQGKLFESHAQGQIPWLLQAAAFYSLAGEMDLANRLLLQAKEIGNRENKWNTEFSLVQAMCAFAGGEPTLAIVELSGVFDSSSPPPAKPSRTRLLSARLLSSLYFTTGQFSELATFLEREIALTGENVFLFQDLLEVKRLAPSDASLDHLVKFLLQMAPNDPTAISALVGLLIERQQEASDFLLPEDA